jgi:hypothetical protein
MLSPLRSDRSGPSEALLAFLPAVAAEELLVAVLPPLALGDEAFDRDACCALLAREPFRVGSFAGGWVRFLFLITSVLSDRGRTTPWSF